MFFFIDSRSGGLVTRLPFFQTDRATLKNGGALTGSCLFLFLAKEKVSSSGFSCDSPAPSVPHARLKVRHGRGWPHRKTYAAHPRRTPLPPVNSSPKSMLSHFWKNIILLIINKVATS